MDTILILAVVAAMAAACFYAARLKPVFVIAVAEGKLRLLRGRPPPFFLQEAEEVVRDAQISAGTIKGYVKNGHIVLSFSRHVPGALRQRLDRSSQSRRRASREHEQLPRPGEIKIGEHRRDDVILTVTSMPGLTVLVEKCTAFGERIAAPSDPSATAASASSLEREVSTTSSL